MPLIKAASEAHMWDTPVRASKPRMSEADIEEKYASREERIVTESNREKLPNFVEALKRPNYMNVRPFYQRRPRWDAMRQSRLIESFIMNVPVPPLFVYETQLNTYEVMDGQQRITAIQSFYMNELKLTGLERWPELNGRTYLRLPEKIRAGIDRRSISYTVLMHESAQREEDAMLLKQLVFERLNTGGVKLSHQEVRNCLYQGLFNSLLLELSRTNAFRRAWGLPEYADREESQPPKELLDDAFYSQMGDIETILRFFALRFADQYQRGMQGFLDLYMARARRFTSADMNVLRDLFLDTISLAERVYGEQLFRPWDTKRKQWEARPQKAFCDAVLVGMSRHIGHARELEERQGDIVRATRALFEAHPSGTFTGRKNTKADVEGRIDLYSDMLSRALSE
ncbi:MAG TPA: DUF262 domain-containing protein [Armatimonadota bacterium]